MSFQHIRETYGVPAKHGARVRYTGDGAPVTGTIRSARGQYIRARFDGEKQVRTLHPTWMLTYLTEEPHQ